MKKVRIDTSVLLLLLIALLLAAGGLFAFFFLRQHQASESLTGDKVISTLFVIEDGGGTGGNAVFSANSGDGSNTDSGADIPTAGSAANSSAGGESPVRPLCSYILMYYPATKRAAVFDVPGSLGQIIQRINRVDRIDTVYDPRRITPFAEELEKLLGIEISCSIAVTLENLGKITDLIEGVELFIPSPVDEYQDGYIMFPSGICWLDGDKAKAYITYELPEENSELANFRRQRFFMGFIKRLGAQNAFLKKPDAAKAFQSLLKTGVNQRTLARLFDEFAKIDTDRVSIQSVGGSITEVSGQQLILPHYDGTLIKDIIRQTLASLVQPAENIFGDRIFTVEVLNGSGVNGLAGRTAELFRGFGYDIIDIGNADNSDYEKTVIIDRSGSPNTAKAFGDVIRCGNIRGSTQEFGNMEIDLNIQNIEYRADITLIIGKDFNGRYVTE